MTEGKRSMVFLSYADEDRDPVEALARRLYGDARISFWFAPWHNVPGVPVQEQMEEALGQAQACAVFVGSGPIGGWQNEQMRLALQTRVEDDAAYRVIPVLLPGTDRPRRSDLPRFLRRYEMVEFGSLDDEQAFKRLLAGILGIPPLEVEGFVEAERGRVCLTQPPTVTFEQGHALVIGVAAYPLVMPLPGTILNDARDLRALLIDPGVCGYPPGQVTLLLDDRATKASVRAALGELALRTGPDDTAVVFFSGHGAHDGGVGGGTQYILPYDCDPANLAATALSGEDMTELLRAIPAGRLLVLFDSCHSGGAGDPKGPLPQLKTGLSEDYYEALAWGKGRVVIASCRPDELSWALAGMTNSLFTHHLLEALRGQATTLGDGYVRVFDLFRHVAGRVPARAAQHPIFKATAMEEDFPVALARR